TIPGCRTRPCPRRYEPACSPRSDRRARGCASACARSSRRLRGREHGASLRTRTLEIRSLHHTKPSESAFRQRGSDVNRHQAQQLLVVELRQLHLVGTLEDLSGQVLLGLDERVDLLLDGASADELVDEHRALLADAIRAVRRLALDGGVPPAIEVDHVAGGREIETGAAGFQRENEERRAVLPLKLLDEPHALLDVRLAREHEAGSPKDARQKLRQWARHLA